MSKPYYEQDGITIYHGDCLEVIPTMGRFYDSVITDPPYAIPTMMAQTKDRGVFRNVGDLSILETAMRTYFDVFHSFINPSGRMFVFCDQNSYPTMFRSLYSQWRTALLVWSKKNAALGREFFRSHELIIHAWLQSTPIFKDGKQRMDVMEFLPVKTKIRQHPAEKPVSLLKHLLELCGPVVLDPFMGSGSTLKAAKDMGYKSIGIEIEERYCEVAAMRLSQAPLFTDSAPAQTI